MEKERMKKKTQYTFILVFLLSLSFSIVSAQKKITILATNDTHSRIEPLPDTDKNYPSMGGTEARSAFINKIRKEKRNVLLFDAGDFVQGTPYFNLFHGRVEAQVMNLMKYDAGTLGNHEFDYGIDTLKMVIDKLDYPIVCCNYDFSGTSLRGKIKPYVILKKYGLKIGVLGIGVDPEGLIQKDKYEGMVFMPVVSTVNKYTELLKNKEKCDLIICLSHIGYTEDIKLAEQSRYIDIIIGGHSHTFMEKPDIRKDMDGKNVTIFQTGKNGVYINKFEVELDKKKK